MLFISMNGEINDTKMSDGIMYILGAKLHNVHIVHIGRKNKAVEKDKLWCTRSSIKANTGYCLDLYRIRILKG